MIDQISIDRIASLHPAIRQEVKHLYLSASEQMPAGIIIRITQALRSIEYQNSLYAQGRTTPGKIVTNARGGSSYHNYGLAFDFCLIMNNKASWVVDTNWMKVVNIFKAAGYSWGGEFNIIKDYPHLEKTFGFTTHQLFTMPRKGGYVILP